LNSGAAESGESEIRRWLLENDLVDAIVALPTNMFFNTGIATYIWILDNTKAAERVGKVQLIDGSQFFTKMRKNLGDKSREISEEDRARIVRIYEAFEEQKPEDADYFRVFDTTDLGYWTITVERPLRLNFAATPDRIQRVLAAAAEKGPLKTAAVDSLRLALESFNGTVYVNRDKFLGDLQPHLGACGIALNASAWKALCQALSERDETADICIDRKGKPEPDVSLRDTENVPFGWAPAGERGDSRSGLARREATIAAYFDTEVKAHAPDAWIDHAKTKTGYEIPFTRHFYKYVPPRRLEEIDAHLNVLVAEIIGLLQEIEK
jgi:type I restriction enzyme M protein